MDKKRHAVIKEEAFDNHYQSSGLASHRNFKLLMECLRFIEAVLSKKVPEQKYKDKVLAECKNSIRLTYPTLILRKGEQLIRRKKRE